MSENQPQNSSSLTESPNEAGTTTKNAGTRAGGNRQLLPSWAPYVIALVAITVGVLIARPTAPADWYAVGLFTLIGFVVLQTVVSYLYEGRRYGANRLATTLITGAFLFAVLPLTSLVFTVVVNGGDIMSFSFLTENNQGSTMEEVEAGLGHAIVGTLIVTFLTGLISVPLGVFTAIYLVEYGKGPFARIITFLVDIMTGIPSIVAGLFAVAATTTVLLAIDYDDATGYRSGLVGAIALVVLMTPIVVRNTEEMLRLVPNELREASLALGVPKWLTIVKVVLRTSMAGIISGVVIATARVIGESAPLMVTAMSTDVNNLNPFEGYMMTLPVFVYEQFRVGNFDQSWGGALVLIIIVVILNALARLVAWRFAPKGE